MAKAKTRAKGKKPMVLEASGAAAGVVTAGSEAVDDYLKAIFELSGREEREVASTEIAVHLAITGASVTNMLQKLAAADPAMGGVPESTMEYVWRLQAGGGRSRSCGTTGCLRHF